MKLGRLQWAAIVIATLLIVAMAPSDKESGDTKITRAENTRSGDQTSLSPGSDKSRTHEVGHVELDRLAKLDLQGKDKRKVGDAFNTTSWYAPPPSPVSHLPAQAALPTIVVPTAPTLPFTYLGRYGDTPSRIIILVKGDRVYTVAVGEIIENTYRVEKFTKGMVNLTYLPLNIEQHLPTGEAL